ncbi:MAG: hypothetical protein II691_02180 [Muribaculaceae bacterium]|nr:hypothetical protein [Muribaculaceae bacterium]
MRKIYAIAAFLLLGAAAMQAQPVAHQAGVAKGNEFKAEMMEPENAGDAVVATEAERAAMSLKAAPATGEAYYYRPAGTFFVGTAATTTYSQFAPYLVVSPYKSYTFKAQEAESYAWRFQIGNNWYELSSRNVNAKYNFESDSVPSLTVGETEYHVFGNKSETEPKSNYSRLYAVPRPADYFGSANSGPYYASPKYFAYRDRDNTGGGTRYFTGSTIGYDGGTGYWFGFNTNGWNGMATYVEEPQNPYLINGGAIRYSNLAFVDATASNNVPIYIDVYSVTSHTDQTLELGEKLATATAYLTNDTPASGGFLYEFDEPLLVNQAIAVVARGYDNEALKGFTLSVARDGWDEGHGQHGYMLKVGEDGVPTQIVGLGNFFSNTNLGVTAPTILLDVEFAFMRYYYSNTVDPVKEFTSAGECLTEGVGDYEGNQLPIWASKPSSNWTITAAVPTGDPEVKADGGELPEWINCEIEDVMTDDAYSHRSVMTISVDENTSTVERSVVLTITQPAAEEITLGISQQGKTTAISVVDAAKNVESVSYFNLAGVESSTPFQGVNIEVKKYTDGSKTTSKVVR